MKSKGSNVARISSYGGPKDAKRITIEALTDEEHDNLIAMMAGVKWVTQHVGRLVGADALKKPPDPIEDEAMLPFWREHQHQQLPLVRVKEMCSAEAIFSPRFYLEAVCGYDYSKENYTQECKKLEAYGFIQMRSRRGPDGKYWELWHLPGVWHANGALRDVIDRLEKDKGEPLTVRDKKAVDAIRDFLCRNTRFGSLEVSIQCACMTIE